MRRPSMTSSRTEQLHEFVPRRWWIGFFWGVLVAVGVDGFASLKRGPVRGVVRPQSRYEISRNRISLLKLFGESVITEEAEYAEFVTVDAPHGSNRFR